MNIFNKVMMVLFLIIIVLTSFIAIVNEFVGYFTWSHVALRLFNPLNDINPYISTLALLLVLAISVFIIILEFYRQRPRVANMSTSKSGNVMMTLETVASQVRASSVRIVGLNDFKIKVIPRANGIIINMQVKLDEGLDLPKKMQEIISNASELVSEKLGIKVIRTNLTVTSLTPGKIKEAEKPKKEVKEKQKDKAVNLELQELDKEKPKPVKKDKRSVKRNKQDG